jgi:hypothetical protein
LTLNPNLNEIDFDLVNSTNHVLIDLTISKKEQAPMVVDESGPPHYTFEKEHKQLPKYDANQQAVQCMLQDISYVCIGKGIRKCCSIESVSDPQCINTE